MENEVVVTRTAKVWLEEDGIIRGIISSTDEHNLTDAKENSEVVMKVVKGKAHPFLTDIRKCKSITREARMHYAGGETGEKLSACALLIGSPVSRIIGNFFLSLNKPGYPVKLFTSETQALEWLRRFIA